MDLSLLDYLQKDNFVFHEIVPTLQEIASFNVALELCSGIIHRKTFKNEEDELDLILRHNFKIIVKEAEPLLQQWEIPLTIKDFISKWCYTVAMRLSNWVCYINMRLFHANFLRRSDLKCLVWQSNGKIDYEMSAKIMLFDPSINQTDKFIIMCEFCWQDEIEGLVPGVELQQFMDELIDDSDGFYEFPLAYYWICKLRNQFDMMPDTEFDSIEFFMVSNYVHHFPSIEYFWSFLNERDQITTTIKLLDSSFMAEKQVWLLAKLNEFQKCSVIAEIPHAILANFIHRSNFEAARFLWNRIANLCSDDRFSTLLTNFMKKLFKEEHFSFLTELWDTAHDHQKNHFVYTRRDFIVEYFFNRTYEYIRRKDGGLPFLFTILSYASPAYRRTIILEHGDVFFMGYQDGSMVHKIIEFCLPNSDDDVQFKEFLQGSHDIESYYSKYIYERCYFKIVLKCLESHVNYQSILKHHVRRVLDDTQTLRNNRIYFFRTWPCVKKLLNIVYGSDLLNVIKIKNKLIFSLDVNDHIYDFFEPNIDGLRHYKNAIQDLIDDKIALAEESAME